MTSIIISGITAPVALALVALLGYLIGYRRRLRESANRLTAAAPDEAEALIDKIQSISNQLRQSMASHHCTVNRCREQIRVLSEGHSVDTDGAPHMHLQAVLGPTDRLSRDIATAYDELRRHTHALSLLRRR